MNIQFPPRPLTARLPLGYVSLSEYLSKGGDPDLPSSFPEAERNALAYPDPVVVPLLISALDQLDAGNSLRVVHEWLLSQDVVVSHEGIRKIWNRERPDHPKSPNVNKYKPSDIFLAPKKKPRTMKDRKVYNRKQKIASQKRAINLAVKKIDKLEEELQEIKKPPSVIREVDYGSEEFLDAEQPDQEPVFKPHPGPQTEFLEASEREVLYGGAAGGGKSYAMLADPMRYFENPNFNGLLLRRTNDELRELIWKSQMIYPQAFPKSKWSERKSSWTFPNGGHLWFTYLERDDDVLRYQGQAFTWIGFDELTQYPTPFAWNYLRSRLRSTDPELSKTLSMRASTNPGGPGHGWVKQMFIDPAPSGTPFIAKDLDTGEDLVFPPTHPKAGQPLFYRKFIPARVQDNPSLWEDGTYEANLLSLPEQQRRQLLDGDWDVADGAAFSEFRRNIHVCEPFEIPRDWLKFRSCDWGYSERQATAVHWYAVDPRNDTIYVYRELYVKQHTATMLVQKIRALEEGEYISYGVLDHNAFNQHGNTGPTPAEEMIRMGVKWRKSDKGPGSRVASKHRLHELLRVDPFSGKPGIIFFDTCRQIIADLPVIPVSKEDDDIDKKYANDHAYDSIRYGIQSRPRAKSPWFNDPAKAIPKFQPADHRFGY